MKASLFMLLAVAFAAPAFADNLNYYCGRGYDSAVVDQAEVALVVQDGKGEIFFDGKQDKAYSIRAAVGGFSVRMKKRSHNDSRVELDFGACQQGAARVTLVTGGALDCVCERE